MDGVITDTESFHMAAELQTCRDYGLNIDETRWGGFKGMTAKAIFDYLILEFGNPDFHSADDMIRRKTDLFIAHAEEYATPIDGVVDFLEFSRERFDRVNLVTSSNRRVQECLVGKFGLERFFDHIVTGDDVTRGKPNPEPYRLSVALSGIAARDSVVIEDSKSGIKSGRSAHCNVLAVTTSHPRSELVVARPHWIAESYDDAEKILTPWIEVRQ